MFLFPVFYVIEKSVSVGHFYGFGKLGHLKLKCAGVLESYVDLDIDYLRIWVYGPEQNCRQWVFTNGLNNICLWLLYIYQIYDHVLLLFNFKTKLWMYLDFNVFWNHVNEHEDFFALQYNWFHSMKAVLVCIAGYSMYLHYATQKYGDGYDWHIMCLYL